MEPRKPITKIFNLLLFLYWLFCISIGKLFYPIEQPKVYMDAIYEMSPSFAILMVLLIGVASVYLGTIILKAFWNRLIADIFNKRNITFDESLAIILIALSFGPH